MTLITPIPSRSVVILPTGLSACKNVGYFDCFKDYCEDNNVITAIVLYPHRMVGTLYNAQNCLPDKATMMPVPIDGCPFSGGEGYIPSLRIILPFLLFTAQVKYLTVVTSGGTSKVVDIANTAGVLAERLGLRVRYIWASKDSRNVYSLNRRPKIIFTETVIIHDNDPQHSEGLDLELNPDGALHLTVRREIDKSKVLKEKERTNDA